MWSNIQIVLDVQCSTCRPATYMYNAFAFHKCFEVLNSDSCWIQAPLRYFITLKIFTFSCHFLIKYCHFVLELKIFNHHNYFQLRDNLPIVLFALWQRPCEHTQQWMPTLWAQVLQKKTKSFLLNFPKFLCVYNTAKKKRPNQLGYLVGIWL